MNIEFDITMKYQRSSLSCKLVFRQNGNSQKKNDLVLFDSLQRTNKLNICYLSYRTVFCVSHNRYKPLYVLLVDVLRFVFIILNVNTYGN